MIVADTNLIAYFLIPGDRTDLAQAAFRRDPAWIAPALWRSELRSVVARYMRHRGTTLAQAMHILDLAEDLVAGEYHVSSLDVLELTQASNCSAYDCELVALALAHRLPLVTADKKLVKAFPDDAVSLPDFVAAAG